MCILGMRVTNKHAICVSLQFGGGANDMFFTSIKPSKMGVWLGEEMKPFT